jgi:hypothetical protein
MCGMPSKDILVISTLSTSRRMVDCSFLPRMTTLSGYGTFAMGPRKLLNEENPTFLDDPVMLPQFSALMGGMWPHPIVTGW